MERLQGVRLRAVTGRMKSLKFTDKGLYNLCSIAMGAYWRRQKNPNAPVQKISEYETNLVRACINLFEYLKINESENARFIVSGLLEIVARFHFRDQEQWEKLEKVTTDYYKFLLPDPKSVT